MSSGFTAFVDDSIAQTGDQRLVLAGYVMRDDIWNDFRAAWAHELARPPVLDGLHMVEAANFRGPFSRWTLEERDTKIEALARLVHEHGLFSFECSLSTRDHRVLFAEGLPYGLCKPYGYCAYGAASGLARHLYEMGAREPIQFVFDAQQGSDDDLRALWDWMKRASPGRWRKLLGPPPRFADDQDEIALQIADMLAWHRRRDIEGFGREETRPTLRLLLSDPHLAVEVDRETLEKLSAGLRAVPYLKGAQSRRGWRDTRGLIAHHVAQGRPPPIFGPRTTHLFLVVRDTLTLPFRALRRSKTRRKDWLP